MMRSVTVLYLGLNCMCYCVVEPHRNRCVTSLLGGRPRAFTLPSWYQLTRPDEETLHILIAIHLFIKATRVSGDSPVDFVHY